MDPERLLEVLSKRFKRQTTMEEVLQNKDLHLRNLQETYYRLDEKLDPDEELWQETFEAALKFVKKEDRIKKIWSNNRGEGVVILDENEVDRLITEALLLAGEFLLTEKEK